MQLESRMFLVELDKTKDSGSFKYPWMDWVAFASAVAFKLTTFEQCLRRESVLPVP